MSPQLQPEQLDCGAAHLQHPLSILQPLSASPVFRAPGLTAVAVASANNYTAVFLGTATGRLLKVSICGWGGPQKGSATVLFSFSLQSVLSESCWHLVSASLLAWSLLPSSGFLTFAMHMLSLGLSFPTGCSHCRTSVRKAIALHHLRGPIYGLTMLVTTLQVPELRGRARSCFS